MPQIHQTTPSRLRAGAKDRRTIATATKATPGGFGFIANGLIGLWIVANGVHIPPDKASSFRDTASSTSSQGQRIPKKYRAATRAYEAQDKNQEHTAEGEKEEELQPIREESAPRGT
ncbi:hypothetical protein F4804DRAFT_330580 [Jackrogersella minutella]|nr:hypothetical protein F4804DRAFT_330580 [Jackrogersella minutella]